MGPSLSFTSYWNPISNNIKYLGKVAYQNKLNEIKLIKLILKKKIFHDRISHTSSLSTIIISEEWTETTSTTNMASKEFFEEKGVQLNKVLEVDKLQYPNDIAELLANHIPN